ncbi:SDR family NAD(P)-dependent oxidoreductase [Microbacterium thalli]|uniref:SDR family NAD(P)-dependent oxidoreductase n=1 Tax=Microbacterium thalli TaxID=3027921 RepID=UPI00236561C0|nr:SDR family oxidoreductase [Microbacterium thalli]MDD7928586.1 SDR family NAD(P)-dependent oxidoreductase [Microbacterium thalli]
MTTSSSVSLPLIVVIGGGTGMGRDIAHDQVTLGRDVLIVGRRAESLEEVARSSSAPQRVFTVVADASTADGAAAISDAVGDRRVQGIVAAAGGQGGFKQPGQAPEDLDDAWSTALRVNLFTAVLPVETLLPKMLDNEGRVVLIGSTAGIEGAGGPYATAKAALAGYGRELARRVGERGITSNTIAPGFVDNTEFFESGGFGDSSTMTDAAAARTLIGRVGRPRDVTASVRWLLSKDGGWITGQVIAVDGGTVMVQ